MDQQEDTVDAMVQCKDVVGQKKPITIDVLNCEMPDKYQKDRGKRVIKGILNKLRLRRSASVDISEPDPMFKVAYLGNVVTGWAKGDGCVEKPLATLWRNYTQSSRPDVSMQLTVSGGGLKAVTRDHGLTEYWANRLTCCAAPSHFPRIFCWVYRHEGKRLRHELRCHAVLCSSSSVARQIEASLKRSISLALAEFKRDKVSRQNARLSLANCIYDNPTMPRRKILLSTGSHNYRPPLERSKSAPKLMSIEENLEEDDEIFEGRPRNFPKKKVLRHHDSTSALLDKRRHHLPPVPNSSHKNKPNLPRNESVPASNDISNCDIKEEGNKLKVHFNDDIDEKSNLIIESLLQDIESCNERNWFIRDNAEAIPLDSDEGSLSSGCESASTVTSDLERTSLNAVTQDTENNPSAENLNGNKTECDFKLGDYVLTRVRSFDRLNNIDIRKYCCINNSLSSSNTMLNEEVSLVPVGESQVDFSSLKVYKKKSSSDSGLNIYSVDSTSHLNNENNTKDDENIQDEGYDDIIDCVSSVSNIVLV